MKTKIIIASLLTSLFAMQTQAQYGSVNAMNNEISDNLDLRAVASLFGDSRNLQDFEQRLNDPKIQISNLDLNYDNQVDYLRVIETVERNTHLIIIQSVLDRDVYQDVATIDVERDGYNKVQVQIVGNDYIYGSNYIYEPVYYSSPLIYASFYVTNYRPYVSSCYWNSYPSYYTAWRPMPLYRYRSNVHVSINVHNTYNYVNTRRSNYATTLYSSRRSNGYERMHPNYSFAQRNSSVNNRYDLDQRRSSRSSTSRNENDSYRNGSSRYATTSRGNGSSSRDYSQNKSSSSRTVTPSKSGNTRDYSSNGSSSTRTVTPSKSGNTRDYSSNKSSSTRTTSPQQSGSSRDYSKYKSSTSSASTPQSSRDYSQNRSSSTRETTSQPSSRSTQSTSTPSRRSTPQATQSQSRSSESRPSSSARSSSSQSNGRSSSSESISNRRS